jgi:hypothetical protein
LLLIAACGALEQEARASLLASGADAFGRYPAGTDYNPLPLIILGAIVVAGVTAVLVLASRLVRRDLKKKLPKSDPKTACRIDLRRARKFMEKRAYRQALELYLNISRISPADPSPRLLAARVLVIYNNNERWRDADLYLKESERYFTAPRDQLIAAYLRAFLWTLWGGHSGAYDMASDAAYEIKSLLRSGARALDWELINPYDLVAFHVPDGPTTKRLGDINADWRAGHRRQ